jgi:hypothetical protein
MAESPQPVSALEPLFATGRVPTGADFMALLNSYWNRYEFPNLIGPQGPPGKDATLPHIIYGYQIQSFNENTNNVDSSGPLYLDYAQSSVHVVTLTSNTQLLGFINVPTSANSAVSFTLYLNNISGYAFSFPSNILWPDGLTPIVSNAKDVYMFTTYDQGATFFGFVAGQNFYAAGGGI